MVQCACKGTQVSCGETHFTGGAQMVESNSYVVGPAKKVLAILALIASNATGASLSRVCRELGIPKTSAFRYLQTLVDSGFVACNPQTNIYSIGIKFRSLASADNNLRRLRLIAQPHLFALVNEFDETANLAVYVSGAVTYVEVVESSRILRIQGRIGDRHPLHSTALGKAILANLSDSICDAEINRSLIVRTSRTVVSVDALKSQLRQIRRQGYSSEVEENDDDAACVGAAILDETGHPLAAISLSAPRTRLPRELVAKAGKRVAETAAAISLELQS